jgi:hypothetical protein
MEVRATTPVDPEPGTPGAVSAVRDGLVDLAAVKADLGTQ